ncbi:hypothetical protein FFI94_008980 [Rhodococcus sp. KBS0724]|jgi:hypothetical protein|uniref:hypothetical protein n=1 Tax=Rhodococcus sp. KBS0724 TaxID=1179674 RepID=UPI00110E9EB5|nr:hypothetical protein [Rhodococcus sp. KBS0724]TSD46282.1 hypothetical protein FFI94_008980 [Rhodococcus sp. KBS0724]
MSAGIDEARRRVQVQETGAALLKLGATNASASVLLAKLVQVVAEEAARTPRFAKAIEEAFAVPSDGSAAVVTAPAPAPRRRAAAPKVKREPGAFDPFDVFKDDGEGVLLERLSALDADGIKDIIAEQEIDTHKETGRKRKVDVLAVWTVERVKALTSKGSAFR